MPIGIIIFVAIATALLIRAIADAEKTRTAGRELEDRRGEEC